MLLFKDQEAKLGHGCITRVVFESAIAARQCLLVSSKESECRTSAAPCFMDILLACNNTIAVRNRVIKSAEFTKSITPVQPRHMKVVLVCNSTVIAHNREGAPQLAVGMLSESATTM